MARTKYEISEACARRICSFIIDKDKFPVRYIDVVEALKQEDVYRPERSIESLIKRLKDMDDHAPSMFLAMSIGAACAYEAAQARSALRQFRSGLAVAAEYFDGEEKEDDED